MTSFGREDFDRLLLADDPAQAIRDALTDGSLDALVPEIRSEMDMPQRTHYHHLTVLEHSLRTMALMPPRLDERLAGLFHDIGKRRTTTIKERTGEEQYIGHAAAGADMTRAILERLGYKAADGRTGGPMDRPPHGPAHGRARRALDQAAPQAARPPGRRSRRS